MIPQEAKRPYRVGVTISIKADGDLAFFSNGLRQNVLFMYKMFESAKNCAEVFLISDKIVGDAIKGELFGVPREKIVLIEDVVDQLDYLIVLGSSVRQAALHDARSRGVKTFLYKGGNAGVLSMEGIAARPPKSTAEVYDDYDCYDQVWITSQHMRTYAGWVKTVYRCPVIEIPQIWSPLFGDVISGAETVKFGFDPVEKAWRIGVLDPNNTVMKTSHYPMLVTEAAFRKRPDIIKGLMVSNAAKYAEHDHFRRFANLLTLQEAGKLSVEHRYISWVFLSKYCDAVVTHHWENGLNYLYYEVLYGNYPLIHNSEFLKDYGYYYEDFNPESGGDALIRAHKTHAANLKAYAKKNLALFAQLNPTAQHNIDLHEGLMFRA